MIARLAGLAMLSVATPAGAEILLNGYDHPGEWTGAKLLHDTPALRVEALADRDWLYLQIARPGGTVSGADVYIGDATRPRAMLHLSSALAEAARERGQTGYDYGVWGANRDWAASVVSSWQADGRTRFTRPEIHEFQIARAKFGDAAPRLMVVLKRSEARAPATADPADSATWLAFAFADIPAPR